MRRKVGSALHMQQKLFVIFGISSHLALLRDKESFVRTGDDMSFGALCRHRG